MIAAGGTGGHIYPALALADLLKKEGAEVSFTGSASRMEAQLIPAAGYAYTPIEIPITKGGLISKARYGISLLKAIFTCRKLLKEQKPDLCVGFGNYISVPLILAAHQLGIKTMISEQNSFAGKANVFLGRYADAVELAYENSAKDFDAAKVRVLGNPQATAAISKKPDPDLPASYGLSKDKPIILVMTGSLGSESVSKIIDEACDELSQVQVLIAAGKKNPYHFMTKNPDVHVHEYVDGAGMLAHCDLAVCRAGATTLAEIAALGVPSILIPSPFVPNNHQYFNARELSDAGAAELIEEKDLSAKILADTIQGLFADESKLKAMRDAAKAIGKPHAGEDMIAWMKELCNEQ